MKDDKTLTTSFLSINVITFNYAIGHKTTALSYPKAVINTERQMKTARKSIGKQS